MTDSGGRWTGGYYVGSADQGRTMFIEPSWLANYPSRATTDFVIYFHGKGGSVSTLFDYGGISNSERDLLIALARRWPVYTADWPGTPGGTDPWGNDAFATYATDLLIACQILWGGKAMLIGTSMGHCSATRMAIDHPTAVKTVAGIIPVSNCQHIVDDNWVGVLGPSFQTAWGMGSSTTVTSAAEVANRAATLTAHGIPWHGWYSDADPVVRPADVQAFAANAGQTCTDVGTNGHSEATVAQIPVDTLAFFLATGQVQPPAWSHRQGATGTVVSSGFTATAAFGSNVTAGSLLVAIITRGAGYANSPTVQTVTDNQGNRWKQAREGVEDVLGSFGADIWYCDHAAGGHTPTVTATLVGFPANAITYMIVHVAEYSCQAPGYECLESGGSHAIDGTSGTVSTLDSCSADDLLITVMTGNATAATVPSGWVSRVSDVTNHMFVADNVDSGAAGVKSAAWTGLTGQTAGIGLILAFKQGGVAPTGPRCEQMQYFAPAVSGNPPSLTKNSPRYEVTPTPGNALLAVCAPHGDCTVNGVVDDQGNVWSHLADSGNDTVAGVDASLWGCIGTWASAPTLTASMAGSAGWPNGPPGGELAWTLLEYSGLVGIGVGVSGHSLMYTATNAPTVATVGSSVAGDLVLAYINGAYAQFDTLSGIAGWRNRMCDSNGSGGLIEKLGPPAGVQTAGWTYTPTQSGSAFVVALTVAQHILGESGSLLTTESGNRLIA